VGGRREHTKCVCYRTFGTPVDRPSVTEPPELTSDPICTADRRGGILISSGPNRTTTRVLNPSSSPTGSDGRSWHPATASQPRRAPSARPRHVAFELNGRMDLSPSKNPGYVMRLHNTPGTTTARWLLACSPEHFAWPEVGGSSRAVCVRSGRMRATRASTRDEPT
jgi:hypothetical protein